MVAWLPGFTSWLRGLCSMCAWRRLLLAYVDSLSGLLYFVSCLSGEGSWLPDSVPCFLDLVTWCSGLGSWLPGFGSQFPGLGPWFLELKHKSPQTLMNLQYSSFIALNALLSSIVDHNDLLLIIRY